MKEPRYEIIKTIYPERPKEAVKVRVIDPDGRTIAQIFGDKIIENSYFAEVLRDGHRIAVLWKDLTAKKHKA